MDINVTPSYDFPLCYRNDTATSWVPTSMEFFFGVFGNFIALILLWINRHDHRWDSFYKLFTGLVITDFIGVIVVYPIATIRYASDFTWCYPKNLCKFVSFIFVDAHLSGALLICAMAVDRFMYSKPRKKWLFSGRQSSFRILRLSCYGFHDCCYRAVCYLMDSFPILISNKGPDS
ncbi:prostaglandin E2 receptor EP4 subtype-like isoform X4 [Ostrea edulis]|uniref:prostaglandin E2 receptor EP4 subtype-like isoform X4 n=1 Tax=Ostrea edulis TaxID=37623 RepID=UPI0024AF4622|nr:prostaglandin E2 receptor EP4 subtype-like isoform X4 [Ostrea edulis]